MFYTILYIAIALLGLVGIPAVIMKSIRELKASSRNSRIRAQASSPTLALFNDVNTFETSLGLNIAKLKYGVNNKDYAQYLKFVGYFLSRCINDKRKVDKILKEMVFGLGKSNSLYSNSDFSIDKTHCQLSVFITNPSMLNLVIVYDIKEKRIKIISTNKREQFNFSISNDMKKMSISVYKNLGGTVKDYKPVKLNQSNMTEYFSCYASGDLMNERKHLDAATYCPSCRSTVSGDARKAYSPDKDKFTICPKCNTTKLIKLPTHIKKPWIALLKKDNRY